MKANKSAVANKATNRRKHRKITAAKLGFDPNLTRLIRTEHVGQRPRYKFERSSR